MVRTSATLVTVLATVLAPACLRSSDPTETPAPTNAGPGTNGDDPDTNGDDPDRAAEPVGPDIGTAHPLVLRRVAANGDWLVACQAREDTDGEDGIAVWRTSHGGNGGDALRPYLFWQDGTELALDAFIGAGDSDQLVVAIREGRLVAYRQGHPPKTLTEAPAVDDANATLPPRAASVAPLAPVVVHLHGSALVVDDLAAAATRSIEVGAGLWRVEALGDGAWARAYLVADDTDANGVVEAPTLVTTLADDNCAGEPGAYSTYGWSGDAPREIWIDLAHGKVVAEDAVPVVVRYGRPKPGPRPTEFKYTRGTRQFRLSGDRWVILDRETGQSVDVAPAPFGADMQMAGDYAIIVGTVLRLSTLEVLGTVEGMTYELLPDGRVLSGPPPIDYGMRPLGPLRWQRFD